MSLLDPGQSGVPSPMELAEVVDHSTVTALVVDDDPDLLDLTASFLERERDSFQVITAQGGMNALDRLDNHDVDAIVSDYDMPEMDGLEFLEAVRERDEDLPFILFTGKGSEQIASEAISKGVTDYLQKETGASQYSILANRVLNAVEKYRAAKTLEESQKKFSKLVKNSSDIIGIVDQNGVFKYISPACERILGYSQEDLIGESAFEHMPTDDRKAAMEEFFAAIEDPDRNPKVEFSFDHPEDGWTIVEARGTNLFEDQFIDGFVVNARDITDLKRNEQELQQQNEQLRDMRKMISHDLRNPLSVASDSLVLYRETDDDRYLEKAEHSLERIETLAEQVLTIADQDVKVQDTSQVPLREVAREAWEMVQTDEATLEIEDSRDIEADPGRLQQIFENLFRNAIKHGSDDVTIRVGTEDSSIYVADDGPGIPEDERDAVFESGYSGSDDTHGFGLSIVKQIVVGHGWGVEIEESESGGARIVVRDVTFQPTVY